MAIRARLSGFGPNPQVGTRGVSQFLRESLGNVCNGVGTFGHFDNSQSQPRCIATNRMKRCSQKIHGVAQLFPRYRVNARRIRNFYERFTQQPYGIVDSGKRIRVHGPFLNQFTTAPGKGQQVSGNISAINRGNVLWIEGMKIARVVPVVQMAAELFEFSDRVERGLDALYRLYRSHPCEIARSQNRKQVET